MAKDRLLVSLWWKENGTKPKAKSLQRWAAAPPLLQEITEQTRIAELQQKLILILTLILALILMR